MNYDTQTNVKFIITGALIFTAGFLFNHLIIQDRIEPWNDGLIAIKCVGSSNDETVRFVAKGMIAYHSGDDSSDAKVMISPAWDPVTRTTEPERPEIILSEYGLGCFVSGLSAEEIRDRADEQRAAY